jgi:hypothetical protein
MLSKEEMLVAAQVADQYPQDAGALWMTRGPINDGYVLETIYDDYSQPNKALIEPDYAAAAMNEYPTYRKYG